MCVVIGGVSSGELQKFKAKSEEIETSLKEISTANQAERRRLASAHSSLSQQSSSDSCAESSQHLRRQLTSLATRQKTLLQCFRRQKEVVEIIETLSATQRVGGSGAEPERNGESRKMPGPLAAIPNLLQHLKFQPVQPPTEMSHTQGAAVQPPPAMSHTQGAVVQPPSAMSHTQGK